MLGEERGHHKIFLGYAPGVGKSYAMLDEAQRRLTRGQDVVIGIIDPKRRKATEDLLLGFKAMPVRETAAGPELDVDSILAAKPDLVLVDDIAHKNEANARRESRWMEVEDILAAGINVLSTLNVSHLESLNEKVAEITGIQVSDTVPDRVLHEAYEIEMVDLTPHALLNRLERGDVNREGVSESKLKALFDITKLTALRELALREAAGRVDEEVEDLVKDKAVSRPWALNDKILICFGPSESSFRLLRRGWRIANRMHCKAFAVYVEERKPTEKEVEVLGQDFKLAERLGIEVLTIKGPVVDSLVNFVKQNQVTQLIIGHSSRSSLQQRLRPSIIAELIRELKTIDVLVVAAERAKETE